MAASTALALPGGPIAYERHRPEQTPLYVDQLDYRTRPCNLVELMPRLLEK